MSTAVVTIIANNYQAHARVLARSLAEHHPEIALHVVNADDIAALRALSIPRFEHFLFRYDRQQVLTAIKPYVMSSFLDRGYERVLFLDADILVLGDLSPVLAPDGDPAVWLTPHLLDPPSGPDRVERELHILRSGAFNGGCAGVSQCAAARRFLAWWQSRVYRHSRNSVEDGMLFDQKWLDHVPIFFDRVGIIRDAGCNVAYWNLSERDPRAIRFFHFSGFDPREPSTMSIHSRGTIPAAIAPLFERYVRELEAAGYDGTHALPWTYNTFDNGVAIPSFVRSILRDSDHDPFGDFHRFLQTPVDDRTPAVTNLWVAVYRARPDVQSAFPDFLGADRAGFVDWTRTSGLREHAIGDSFALTP